MNGVEHRQSPKRKWVSKFGDRTPKKVWEALHQKPARGWIKGRHLTKKCSKRLHKLLHSIWISEEINDFKRSLNHV